MSKTSRYLPRPLVASPPAWLRYAVVALAAVIMCSCRTSRPEYRVADDELPGASEDVALLQPDSVTPDPRALAGADADDAVQTAAYELATAPEPATPLPPPLSVAPGAVQLAAATEASPVVMPLLSDRNAFRRGAAQPSMSFAHYPASPPAAPLPQTPQPQAPQPAAYQTPVAQADSQVTPAGCPPGGCVTAPYGPMDCCPDGFCCNQDAIRGPSDEYLCDGGDFGLPAAVIKTGEITGLEQEDAVAHYETIDGRTILTPSNKVCVYAPRFAAVREVVDVRAYARYEMPEGAIQPEAVVKLAEPLRPVADMAAIEPVIDRAKRPPSLLVERQNPGELGNDQRLAQVIGSLAPYANLSVIRTGEVIGTERAKIARSSLAAITWAGDQAPQVLLNNQSAQAVVSVKTPGTIYLLVEPNNPKLRLIKLADKSSAQLGEEVEFTLRFDNLGDRVIGNVTIVDHLTTRLEYVPETQKSSLKANFSTQPDASGSLTLRWEITDPLEPGKGGVLQFRAKVR